MIAWFEARDQKAIAATKGCGGFGLMKSDPELKTKTVPELIPD